MGKIVSKIVLTGGPCAGKTTALCNIEEYLTERGYKVFIVPESATELIKGGIHPFGENAFNLLKFQDLILKYQRYKEDIYEEAALNSDSDKCVIIYDRGIMDNRAYINEDEFNSLLEKYSLKKLEIFDRYDLVMHLVSAADGAKENYTTSNNSARSESIQEAIILDRKTMNAWTGHNNLVVIDNKESFKDKMDRVLSVIKDNVLFPYEVKYQKKYLVDVNDELFEFMNRIGSLKVDIMQSYLGEEDGYERRLRRKVLNREKTYYFTVQRQDKGKKEIITNRKINIKEYNELLNISDVKYVIEKSRYIFIYEKQYFTLDVFDDGKAILKVNLMNEEDEVVLPSEISAYEVTNKKEYSNYFMAKDKESKLTL